MASTKETELINGIAAVIGAYVRYAEAHGGPEARGFADYLDQQASRIPATPQGVPPELRGETLVFQAVATWVRNEGVDPKAKFQILPGGKDDD